MPQLPSGRHVALSMLPLEAMVQRVIASSFITELLVIERREDLYPYVELLYLEQGDGPVVEMALGSHPMPAELREVPSGLTLATMSEEIDRWPYADQRAFLDFIESDRAGNYLDEALAWVQAKKRELVGDGRFAVACQAGWWLAGVHPLQSGGQED